jgi:hypothetical protein
MSNVSKVKEVILSGALAWFPPSPSMHGGRSEMSNVQKVKEVILSGGKYSKGEISDLVGLPTETVRGVLRDLRKPRFGSYAIHSARESNGTCVYWFDPTMPVTVAKSIAVNKKADTPPAPVKAAPVKRKKPAKKPAPSDGTIDRIVNEVMRELFARFAR